MLDLTTIFSQPATLAVMKVTFLIGQFVYAVFAYIIVRQVALMNHTFQTEFSPFFKLVAYIHFYTVLGLLVLSVILL